MKRLVRKSRCARWHRRVERWFRDRFTKDWEHPEAFVTDPQAFPEDQFPMPCMECGYDLRGEALQTCPECGRRRLRSRDLAAYYARRELPERDPQRRWRQRLTVWIPALVLLPTCVVAWASDLLVLTGFATEEELSNVGPPPLIMLVAFVVFFLGGLIALMLWEQYQRFRSRGGIYDAQLAAGRDLAPFKRRREKVLAKLRLPKRLGEPADG